MDWSEPPLPTNRCPRCGQDMGDARRKFCPACGNAQSNSSITLPLMLFLILGLPMGLFGACSVVVGASSLGDSRNDTIGVMVLFVGVIALLGFGGFLWYLISAVRAKKRK